MSTLAAAEWLSGGDVARRLGVSRSTVLELRRRGRLTGYRYGPAGHYRYRRGEVERLLAASAEAA